MSNQKMRFEFGKEYHTCERNIRRIKRTNKNKANVHLDITCGVHRSRYL